MVVLTLVIIVTSHRNTCNYMFVGLFAMDFSMNYIFAIVVIHIRKTYIYTAAVRVILFINAISFYNHH